MAIVTTYAHSGTAFSFLAPHWWNAATAFADGNATQFAVFDDQAALGFTGKFSYDKDGRPSGTATVVDYEALDGAIYKVSGVSLVMSTVATQLETPTSGPAFMAYMLAGNDTINSLAINDTVAGYAANDTLAGYAGDDRINLRELGGRADGGSGTDTLAFVTAAGHGVQASLLTGRATDLNSGATMTLAGFEHLVGSSSNDVLQGNASANRIDGGSGTLDLVSYAGVTTAVTVNLATGSASGGGGSDTLVGIEGAIGGKAADRLIGSSGADWLEGGAGIDTLSGGLGNDTYVTDGTDVIVETADGGIDTIRTALHWTLSGAFENLVLTGASALRGNGSALANRIEGNEGNNVLDGAAGRDTLAGGLGDDTYLINDADVIVEGLDTGFDTVRSTISYTLSTHVEKLVLLGSDNLTGIGSAIENQLYGNAGANVLDGKAGLDVMYGGLGNDTYVADATQDQCIEASNGGIDTVKAYDLRYTLGDHVENLVMVGNATWSMSYATGNGLANRITGSVYADEIDGRAGADTMAGGLGDDTYFVDNTSDVVSEAAGAGIDTIHTSVSYTMGANVERIDTLNTFGVAITGNAQDNAIDGYFGADTLAGGAGADTLRGSWGNDVYVLDAQDVLIDSGGIDEVRIASHWTVVTGIENATLLGSGDFNLTGNSAANVLTGNAGDNVLDGSSGVDTLIGGAGDDSYYVTAFSEQTIEEADQGTDTVHYNGSSYFGLAAHLENLVLGASATDGYGNALDNRITGNAQDNFLWGGTGADTLIGGAGVDTYHVDDDGDNIVETNLAEASIVRVRTIDHWTLTDSLGASTVLAEGPLTTAFTLQGNADGNLLKTVVNNTADDVLIGGGGADTMYGYAGNDTYWIDNAGDVASEASTGGSDTVIASIDYTLRSYFENLGLSGSLDIDATGNGVDNVIWGNVGNNALNGGSGIDTVSYATAGAAVDANLGAGVATGWGTDTLINFENLIGSSQADRLKGNNAANAITGGGGADKFSLDGGQLLAADLFTDFGNGADRLEVRQNTLAIGNGDTVIDLATTTSSPGGYSSSAELVVVDALIEGSITASAVALALGRANSGFSVGQTMLVAVHNATDAAVYQFKSSGNDWSVSSTELTRLALLDGSAGLKVADFLFTGG